MGFSVASLLIQLRPGEKRERGRWRPGWRYQKGPGRGLLFLFPKMGQDLVDVLPRFIGNDVLNFGDSSSICVQDFLDGFSGDKYTFTINHCQ